MTEKNKKNMLKMRLIGILPLLLIVIGIILFSVNPSPGKFETIPQQSFARYEGSHQRSEWVQMDVASISYIGSAQKYVSTKTRKGTLNDATYYELYLIKDEDGRTLIYGDKNSLDMSLIQGKGSLEKRELPFTIYGYLTTFSKSFSDYNGYEQLKEYGDYDLIEELEYAAQAKQYIDADNASIRNVISTLGSIAIISGFVLLFIFRRIAKRRESVQYGDDNSPNS